MKHRGPRYEPLLKYKSFIEDAMRQELINAADILVLEEKRLFALEEIWRQAVEDLKVRQAKEGDPNEISMYHTYMHHLSIEIESQRKNVVEATDRFNEKRGYLVEATKERKMVEKVLEKDKKEMIEDINRAEKKKMDETARNRYLRDNC